MCQDAGEEQNQETEASFNGNQVLQLTALTQLFRTVFWTDFVHIRDYEEFIHTAYYHGNTDQKYFHHKDNTILGVHENPESPHIEICKQDTCQAGGNNTISCQ